jgi:hypothetical protein
VRSLLAAELFAARAEKAYQRGEAQERAVVVARDLYDQVSVVKPGPVMGDLNPHVHRWRFDQSAARSLGYRRPNG